MANEMRTDAELLDALLNEASILIDQNHNRAHSFNVKVVAHWTGLSVQTISDYRTGKTNIPVDFWRRILEHNFDMRIVRLLIPDAYHADITPLTAGPPRTGPQWFRQAVEAEGKHHEQQVYLAEILADGRVDETDAATIQAYDDAFFVHRQRDALLHRAIVTEYRRAVARKEASRS